MTESNSRLSAGPNLDEVVAVLVTEIETLATYSGIARSTALSDVNLDSLDLLELLTILQDEFDVEIDGMSLVPSMINLTVEQVAHAFVNECGAAALNDVSQ